MSEHQGLDALAEELQRSIDRLASQLGVQSLPVGSRTNDGLNIYVDAGGYHYDFWERGRRNFDRVGSLDDVLYWYAQDIAFDAAPHGRDRRRMFQCEFEILSQINPEWGKRCVRENAAMLRDGQPEDIALLPDIGEPL